MIPNSDAKQALMDALHLDDESLIENLNRAVSCQGLTGPVVEDSCKVAPLCSSVVMAGTAGLWRLTGVTHLGEQWRLIIKGLRHQSLADSAERSRAWYTTNGDRREPFNWQRELAIYEKKVLAEAIGGVRTARFYGRIWSASGLKRRVLGIALEDLSTGLMGPEMSMASKAHVVRSLGRMQGSVYRDRELGKRHEWILAQRHLSTLRLRHEGLERVGKMTKSQREHPALRPFMQRTHGQVNLYDAFDGLWAERAAFARAVERSPYPTLTHGDAWSGNVAEVGDDIVLLDLSNMGWGAIGVDAGKFSFSLMDRNTSATEYRHIHRLLKFNYFEGLSEAGVDTTDPTLHQYVELAWMAGQVATYESYVQHRWIPRVLSMDPRDADRPLPNSGSVTATQVSEEWANKMEVLLEYAECSRDLLASIDNANARSAPLVGLA